MPIRRPSISDALAYFPALVLALLSCWSGTFQAPMEPWAVALGHLALCALAALAGPGWRDPLGLGSRGWWPIGALGLWCALATLASPVPRAGRLTLVLGPIFLLLPAAVARCWRGHAARRRGLRAVTGVVAVIALVAVVEAGWLAGELGRTAMPLGQHGLLALWLVALLPVACLGARHERGISRWIGALAAVLALVALVASRSLAALGGVLAALLWIALRAWRLPATDSTPARRAPRRLLVAGLLVVVGVLVWQGPRLGRVLEGQDASLNARLGYWDAGWRGVLERPWLGWGPGSTPWTVARFLEPVPGIHPPHDVVANLHNLPLQLAYELGLPGLLLLVWLGFSLLRRGWRRTDGVGVVEGDMALAGQAGLLALSIAGLGGLPLEVMALPVVLALLLAMQRVGTDPGGGGGDAVRPWGRWPPRLVALGALFFLLPVDMAQGLYDRAIELEGGEETRDDGESRSDDGGASALRQLAELRRAAALDPGFPLYHARLSWLEAVEAVGDPEGRRWAARRARRAAEDAGSVAPLWLMAGVLAQEADEPWARTALLEACRLDPLGAMAPYRLALHGEREPLAELWAARALLAEPRLLAAEEIRRRPSLLRVAVDRARLTEGVDPGWRSRLVSRADQLFEVERRRSGRRAQLRRLVLTLDEDPAQSPSLYTFRRRPWPGRLVTVALYADLVALVDLPAATRLATTAPRLFEAPLCGLGEAEGSTRSE